MHELGTLGQRGDQYTRISKEKQQAAVKFIAENGLQTPTWLIDSDILRKIEPNMRHRV